jgi:dolichyl-phosphate-mannose-protein mannosyltransferase
MSKMRWTIEEDKMKFFSNLIGNHKRLAIFATVLLSAIVVIAIVLISRRNTPVSFENLLQNPGFEDITDGLPDKWYTDAYIITDGYTVYDAVAGNTGNGVRIINSALNDARFAQTVTVAPNTLYCLSGFIKAMAEAGLGANLSIEGVYVFSESVYDTQDGWKEIVLYGRTGGSQTSVTVFARLGGYSGESIGEAVFDNLSLKRVDAVPAGYAAVDWFTVQPQEEETAQSASAWPWLLLIVVLYMLISLAAARKLAAISESPLTDRSRNNLSALIFVLIVAFTTRVATAILIPGYSVDIGCFTAWANQMAKDGPAGFYGQGGFSDYPPGYMLVLWLVGLAGRAAGTGATEFLVKFPPIFADIAAAAVLFGFVREHRSRRSALMIAALYAFNPLTYLTGAAWGQVDSLTALGLMLVVIFGMKGKWHIALPVYMTCVLIKPQALMLGPLGAAVIILELVRHRDRKLIADMLIGLGISVVVAAAIIIPFSVRMQSPGWIVDLYTRTMTYYSGATVNATNLYFLFGQNWVDIASPAPLKVKLVGCMILVLPAIYCSVKTRTLGKPQDSRNIQLYILVFLTIACAFAPISFSVFGTVLLCTVIAVIILQYVRGNNLRHLPLLGAVMLLGLCNLGVMMHERYLFAAVLLLFMAFVVERDKRVFFLMIGITAAVFLNVGCVLDRGIRIGGSAGHLDAPLFNIASDSAPLEYIVAFLNCALTGYAFYLSDVLTREHALVLPLFGNDRVQSVNLSPSACVSSAEKSLLHPFAARCMHMLDWFIILAVTAVYSVFAFVNLGSVTAPQTSWTAKKAGEQVTLDLQKPGKFDLLYYGGIHQTPSDFTISVSPDNVRWSEEYPAEMREGSCFQWKYLVMSNTYEDEVTFTSEPIELEGRYIRITSGNIGLTLFEVIARDPKTSAVLPITVPDGNGKEIIDEQATMTGEPSYFNSMYFDEIYHGRTAYEQYNAILGRTPSRPYETTHPPLGKLLMTFCIFIFGMTPFGWRFAGTLAGVLMLPGMYMLGKSLFKRREAAFGAMFLLAVDCMHFTQTRLATIDSFVVLFIIWSVLFMFRYAQLDYFAIPLFRTLPPLFLSGLFIGLAIASKWTGLYAGLGLAAVFFWTVYRHYMQAREAKRMLKDQRTARREVLETAVREHDHRLLITLGCCIVFFVMVPAVIYYLSYIPYFMSSGGVSVSKIIDAARNMLAYHSKPGLGMDHPFYSPWFEWPLSIKPIFYYQGNGEPTGNASTIMGMGNLAVWWGGLVALLALLVLWARRRFGGDLSVSSLPDRYDIRPALILLTFLAQYLPWIPVPRGTYIYHYFTAVPFIIVAAMLCYEYWSEKHTKWARIGLYAYFIIALGIFIAFFPYASGATVSIKWLESMRWFKNWIYY